MADERSVFTVEWDTKMAKYMLKTSENDGIT